MRLKESILIGALMVVCVLFMVVDTSSADVDGVSGLTISVDSEVQGYSLQGVYDFDTYHYAIYKSGSTFLMRNLVSGSMSSASASGAEFIGCYKNKVIVRDSSYYYQIIYNTGVKTTLFSHGGRNYELQRNGTLKYYNVVKATSNNYTSLTTLIFTLSNYDLNSNTMLFDKDFEHYYDGYVASGIAATAWTVQGGAYVYAMPGRALYYINTSGALSTVSNMETFDLRICGVGQDFIAVYALFGKNYYSYTIKNGVSTLVGFDTKGSYNFNGLADNSQFIANDYGFLKILGSGASDVVNSQITSSNVADAVVNVGSKWFFAGEIESYVVLYASTSTSQRSTNIDIRDSGFNLVHTLSTEPVIRNDYTENENIYIFDHMNNNAYIFWKSSSQTNYELIVYSILNDEILSYASLPKDLICSLNPVYVMNNVMYTVDGRKVVVNKNFKLTDNIIGSNHIIDSAVISAKIADSAINTDKIIDGAVTGVKLDSDLAYNLTPTILNVQGDKTQMATKGSSIKLKIDSVNAIKWRAKIKNGSWGSYVDIKEMINITGLNQVKAYTIEVEAVNSLGVTVKKDVVIFRL